MLPRSMRLLIVLLAVTVTNCTAPRKTTGIAPMTTPARPGAEPSIVPRPAALELLDGQFSLSAAVPIVIDRDDPQVRLVAGALSDALRTVTGQAPEIRTAAPATGTVAVRLVQTPGDAALGPEGYELTIRPEGISLRASEPRGLFWGVQTIRQLLPPSEGGAAPTALPALRIVDRPRYAWRGMHLDVCRHMFPVAFVKRYIDLMALHKMNTFHWHLTEDQGWRIEIKKYPKLTEIAAWRLEQGRKYGGFYTQAQVREVVAYAAARFITVVPEIEMPGHSRAALAAYPELSCTGGPFEVATTWGVFEDVFCAGNEATFTFLEDVLAEVIDLFPGPYLHIGGDECPKARWKACPKCQARIQAEGLADEDELQSYFIKRIATWLDARGKRLVGWDEILEGGLAPSATVMSWRGTQGGIAAARLGHNVVMTPMSPCYFNYPQTAEPGEPGHRDGTLVRLRDVYAFEPTPANLTPDQARHVLGAQGNLWSEFIATPQEAEYMAFPRLCALAETVWTPPQRRAWDDFARRLTEHRRRLDALGVRYCDKDWPACR